MLIHRFKTKNNFYVYDTCTNKILQVDRIVWDILGGEKAGYAPEKLKEAEEAIENAKKSGLFSHSPLKGLKFPFETIPERLKNLRQLILNLTEKCNLRCRYCVYSGSYYYERTHSDKMMPWDVARRAIDYFLENATKEKRPFITFYGGEPMLNPEVLRKSVLYAKERRPDVRFNFTTNGVYLPDDMLDFLVQNRVFFSVSLDGPQEIHDRYRVKANGEGTFRDVVRTLRRIREKDEEYFNTCVGFIVTIAPPYDLLAIDDFFSSFELFPETSSIVVSLVDENDTTFFEGWKREELEEMKIKNFEKAKDRFVELITSGRRSAFLNGLFDGNLILIHKREMTPLPPYHYPNGICLPGERRLFVSTDGKFYICEKMGERLPIGDVERGIDIEKVENLIKRFIEISDECLNCWAVRLCNACFIAAKKGNELSRERKKENCEGIRSTIDFYLTLYTEIREKKEDALDYLKNVEME